MSWLAPDRACYLDDRRSCCQQHWPFDSRKFLSPVPPAQFTPHPPPSPRRTQYPLPARPLPPPPRASHPSACSSSAYSSPRLHRLDDRSAPQSVTRLAQGTHCRRRYRRATPPTAHHFFGPLARVVSSSIKRYFLYYRWVWFSRAR